MLFIGDKQHDMADSPALKFLRRHLPVTPDLHGPAFWVRRSGDGAAAPPCHADLLGQARFPPALSLGITLAILGTGVACSLWRTRPGPAGRIARGWGRHSAVMGESAVARGGQSRYAWPRSGKPGSFAAAPRDIEQRQ